MKELIKALVEAYGPSGDEAQVREVIAGRIKDRVSDLRVDALGNLIATVRGTGGGRRVMLAAHMDEIGVIASFVDEKGFVRFNPVGGLRVENLIGGRVRFANGQRGVIGAEQKGVNGTPAMEQLFIDVGARSKETCPVQVGDMACMDRDMVDLGERLVAKAMDDRIACAVLVQTLLDLGPTPHDVSFCFTVQEEVGLRGAQTSAYGVDADLGIAVDVTLTGDTPEARTMAVALGDGPAIKVKDSGMIAHQGMRRWLVDTARQAGIPYQLEVLRAGTTDGRAMQTTRAGIPVGVISIPCRYVHAPSEMVDYADVQNSVRLLVAALRGPITL